MKIAPPPNPRSHTPRSSSSRRIPSSLFISFLLTFYLVPSLLLSACQPEQTITVRTAAPATPPPPPPTHTAAASPTAPETDPAINPSPEPLADLPTPSPSPTPGPLVFAVIGDYGQQGPDEAAVAELVKSWNPAFIITTGDNNYPSGDAATIDQNVGQYYHEFIFPYTGAYGEGADVNRFFPSPGNHDWRAPDLQPYLDYFTLPGNERYYDFVWGPVHFFALDSDTAEPDGVGLSSMQAEWLKAGLAASTSPWNIVYMHHPPYSSSRHGSTDYIQWPFAEWGADAVLSGHDHVYERLIIDDLLYITNGVGGYPNRYFFFTKLDGSQFQWRAGYGALRVTADENSLFFEMITTEGEVIDTHLLTKESSADTPLSSVTTLPDPAGYQWLPVAAGYDRPLLITHAGDGSGRLFVVEQPGTIYILGQEEAFLDIRDRVNSDGFEQGLLGLAFHPDFITNGAFFINYTDLNGDTVIARYQVRLENPDQADPASETILLRIDQPYRNHNGGHLAFGPNGLLYAGMGDGGSAGDPEGNAQNPLSLLGKLLTIDVDTGEVDIFATGLRNPWRFSFDRLTGDLYIGDVGQNEWEEIDFLPAGSPPSANFGWDVFEGFHPFEGESNQDVIFPILEYNHSAGACSVTGGHVYRGAELPDFFGVYLFADYCNGVVFGLVRDDTGAWTYAQLFDETVSVTSFGEDEAGEIYLVGQNGVIFKLSQR